VVEFAYVSTPFRSDLSTSGTAEVELRVWRADRKVEGARVAGGWEVRQGGIALSSKATLAESAKGLKVIDQGELPAVLNGEIPVTFAFYDRDQASDCPMGISLVADTADAARVIYNCLSWAMEVNALAAFPFLAVPMQDTGGKLDQSTAAKLGPAQGLGYSSGAGAPQWVEPSGTSQKELREHCVFTFQWAMRCAGLELAADSSAQVQSGEALRIRSRDFESRALRFARNMQRWEIATLRLYARMAGVDPEPIAVTYAKRITMSDPGEDLARALTVLAAPIEIGPEARAMLVKVALDASIPMSDEELGAIYEQLRAMYLGDLTTYDAKQAVERMRAENEAKGLALVGDEQQTPAPVAVDTAPETDPNAAPVAVEAVADTALNGAQVSSLLEIITSVGAGTLPAETARAVILAAFPTFDAATIENMLAPFKGRAPSTPTVAPAAPTNSTPPVTDATT
jgi:hypothetical protein